MTFPLTNNKLIIIATLVFLIILPLEGELLVLTPVSPFSREVGVFFPRVQLLVLLQEPGHRESLPARVTRPGLLARVCPLVDVQVGRQLVGLPAHVAAVGSLVGVQPDVHLQVPYLGESLVA